MTPARRDSPARPTVARVVTVLVATAAALVAEDVRAQGAPALPLSNEQRAEQLFRAGEKKFDTGQHAEACVDFERSLRLGPKLGTLLNLALCHETVGKVATAWREFQHASAWAALNNQRDRHEFAVQHVLALESRLPRVVLQLPLDRAMASLEVDGEPLPEPRWNLPVYLDPGEHAVAVSAPGKRRATVTFRVSLSPTEQIVVVPPLADEGPARAAQPPGAPRDDAGPMRPVGIGLLAVGGAAVVTGLVLGGLSLAKGGDAEGRCPEGVPCDPEGIDLWRSAHALSTGAVVGLGVGVVLAGAGGVVLWRSRGAGAAIASRGAVAVSPAQGARGAIVGLSGTF
jgi:hypothetical protein